MGCMCRDVNDRNVNNRNVSDRDSYSHSKKTENRNLFLECGHNPQSAIFEIDDGVVEQCQAFILDRVLVDTSFLKRPIVKIDFFSIVFFEGESEDSNEPEVEVDLLFRLERVCNGVADTIQTWRYLKEFDVEGNNIDELEIEISESFAVSFCDRACPDCCEYRMIVEGIDFEGEFEALRVVNPTISAFVQSQCD